ncbi:MAG: hypothetical protein OEW17_04740, partial [Gemmatimonadota bacterium]|nr:hypothetical protein [Gemmatimonadota bacterium]
MDEPQYRGLAAAFATAGGRAEPSLELRQPADRRRRVSSRRSFPRRGLDLFTHADPLALADHRRLDSDRLRGG